MVEQVSAKPTREQILSEPAGPDLDSLVARLVMGYRLCRMPRGTGAWAMPSAAVAPDLTWLDGPWRSLGEFRPSTQMDDAWEVMSNVPERYKIRQAGVVMDEPTRTRAFCDLHSGGGVDEKAQYQMAPVVPLAICRAALLAVLDEG